MDATIIATVAVPLGVAAISAVGAVVLGFINRIKIGAVETKVDGNLSGLRDELREMTAALARSQITVATAEGHAAGVAETKAEQK